MEEIELTFLAKNLPEKVFASRSSEVLDIYIPSSLEHPVLRIRKAGERHEITKKEPIAQTDSSHQLETTIPLSQKEYEELSRLEGKRIRKIRYYYNEDGVDYEIDVFKDGLEGLVLVDVEFDSKEKKEKFVAPAWCLIDVTNEDFVAGGMLCGKNYSEIENNIMALEHKK
jgi:CYTH domain-containing protein